MAEAQAPSRTVLCAIDLSQFSEAVLAMAAEMAELCDGRLLVVHAVELWDSRYDFMVTEIAARIENNAREKLNAELAHLRKTHAAPVEVRVEKGPPLAVLREIVRKERPDLIVVGHGRQGIDRLLLGSVAEKVLRLSPTPVLVVRPPRNPDIKKIACAVDMSECSRMALESGIEVAQAAGLSQVEVIHTFEVPVGYLEAGMTYETAFGKTKAVHEKGLSDFLQRYTGGAITCEPIVEEGPAAATLVKRAQQDGADLLVIGAHGRSAFTSILFGGTSSKVVRQATMPVLVIKSTQHYETLWQALDRV